MERILLLFRVPAEPSRHRVAVWRELRCTGAVSVGQSAWLAPAAPAFADGIARAVQLVQAAGGEAIVLDASGRQPADAERLRRWHRELRLRDVFGALSAAGADQRLKECEAKLEDYTQRVFQAVAGQ